MLKPQNESKIIYTKSVLLGTENAGKIDPITALLLGKKDVKKTHLYYCQRLMEFKFLCW